jgi:hypothetical protein
VYRKLPFQFTIRQLFLSVAYLCTALAIISWMVRYWDWLLRLEPFWLGAYLVVLGALAVAALLGATIGELRGDSWFGAFSGFWLGCMFFLALPVLVPFIYILLFGWFPMHD